MPVTLNQLQICRNCFA